MADEIVEIIKIDIDFDKAITDTLEYKKRIKSLRDELDLYTTEEEKLSAEYVQKTAQMKGLLNEKRKLENLSAKLASAQEIEGLSIQKLTAENAKLLAEQQKLNLLDEVQLKRNKEINEAINRNTDLIKENVSKQTQQKLNVGNYTESIQEAIGGLGQFNQSLEQNFLTLVQINQQEGGVASFWQTLTSGIKGATTAALAFLATPLGLAIAAITTLIVGLTGAVSRNKDMVNSMSDAWASAKGVFSVMEKEANKLFDGLLKMITGDFKNGWDEFTDGILKSNFAWGILSGEMRDAAEQFAIINQLQRQMEKGQINNITNLAKLSAEEQKYALIADDNTKTLAERTAANEKLIQIQKQRANFELQQAKIDELAQAKRINELERTNGTVANEDRKLYFEAVSRRIKAEADFVNAEGEGSKKRREIAMEETERKLDFLIDGYDAVKTANEKIVNNEKYTLTERQKYLDETVKYGNKAFNEQIETIGKFHKIRIDGEKLMQQTDAETVYNTVKNLGVNDVLAGRLLEIYRERKMAISDLQEAQQTLNDAQIANTIETTETQIKIWQLENKTLLDGKQKLNSDLIKLETERLTTEANMQNDLIKKQFKNKLITENQFTEQTLQNQIELNESIKKINSDYAAQQNADAISALTTDYENRKELLSNNLFELLEIERENLRVKKDLELAAAKDNGANVLLIEKKYAKAEREIDKAKISAKLDMAKNLFSGLASLAGENTRIGKIAAIATTTIDTYQGAQSAFAQTPGGIAIKSAAAAVAVATGLANLRKILSVKSGLPGGDGGSAGSISGATSAGQSVIPTNLDVNPVIGQGIVTRSQIINNEQTSFFNPVLVLDEVTSKQKSESTRRKTSIT